MTKKRKISKGKKSKTSRKEHHVVPNKKEGGWDVKINKAGRRTFHTRKKSTAIKKARAISRKHKSELVIHSSKGKIQVKNSHPKSKSKRAKSRKGKK
jgi:hypothetical protein